MTLSLTLIKVSTASEINDFLSFPSSLHKHNQAYIRPLDSDIEKIFDPKRNNFFEFGKCERYLVIDKTKQCTVGRFAVFTNQKYIQSQATGGIGFVDFIDDIAVSHFIFEQAKAWHMKEGMEAMDGPINFGEREQWWGLLIEGFHEPLYGMNNNLPYYQKHFEAYGFQEYFQQLCFSRKVDAPLSRKINIAHQRMSRYPNVSLCCIHKSKLNHYAKDFAEVYNKAWATHGDGKQMNEEQVLHMFKRLKNILDPNIAFMAFDGNEPIGLWINFPDLNQWIKTFKGKMGFWQKISLYIKKRSQKNKRMVGIIFGIVPAWQGKGLDGYMIWEGGEHIKKYTQYQDYEMQWIGDFNPKMISLAKQLETEVSRKLITYRYLFDQHKNFERHPTIS